MAIKRSTSTSPSDTDTKDNISPSPSPQSDDIPADLPKKSSAKRSAGDPPSTPKAGKVRKASTAALGSGSKLKGGAVPTGVDWSGIEGMTPDKKEALVDHLISVGSSSAGVAKLAELFNIPKTVLASSIQAGKPGNLRGKLLKAARGV